MKHPESQSEAVGAKMAETLALLEAQHAHATSSARRRLFAAPEPRRTWVTRTWAVSVAASLAAVGAVGAAGVTVLLLRRPTASLTVQVDGQAVAKDTFVAAEERPLPFTFSDGSMMQLERQSGLRVLDLGPHGAEVLLERGTLQASVVHLQHSHWRVLAGPYTVDVIGTIFDVKWEPVAAQLSVHVAKGQVRVKGGALGTHDVAAGQSLRVRDDATRIVLESEPSEAVAESSASAPVDPTLGEPPAASESSAPESPHLEGRRPTSPPNTTPRPSTVTSTRGWRKLANQGQFAEALAVAKASGFEAECATGSAADLLQLSDVARYAGDVDLARRALLVLRQRFPSDSRSAAAAFVLGKLSIEHFGNPREAVTWFDVCLSEQPSGGLAPEARGRRMEALHALKDGRARSAANEYLSRHPEGPHAALARRILAE